MAWTTAYATAGEYRDRVAKSITSDDTAIDAALTAISRVLEHELGRVFNQSAAGEARYFDPVNTIPAVGIAIDDIVAMTELAIDRDGNASWETVAAAGDALLRPYNAPIYGRPYTSIYPSLAPSVALTGYAKAIRITGTWGWPAVPQAIKEATIQLAAILRIESPRAQSTVSELGGIVGMSAQGRGIIERLQREYSRKALIV